MGTWGSKSFENDTALDWAAELADSDDLSLVERAFELEDGDAYVEADTGATVVAASEVVLVLMGLSAELPDVLDSFTKEEHNVDLSRLRDLSCRALRRVLAERSELKELWMENTSEYSQWRQNVEMLISKLEMSSSAM
jgi:hypothetical protein